MELELHVRLAIFPPDTAKRVEQGREKPDETVVGHDVVIERPYGDDESFVRDIRVERNVLARLPFEKNGDRKLKVVNPLECEIEARTDASKHVAYDGTEVLVSRESQ
jgi:hypothetical protein